MFSSCNPKFFAVRHIHYPVNPSSDHFHTDAVYAVVPSNDHSCTETVLPSSDHCRTEAVLPPSDHYCIETVPPSSDHYGTTKVEPLSGHLHTGHDLRAPPSGYAGAGVQKWPINYRADIQCEYACRDRNRN